MQSALSLAILMVALVAGPALAADPPREACCACLPDGDPTLGANGPMQTPALFCALITSEADDDAFTARCDALNGKGLCVAMVGGAIEGRQDGLDCVPLLAETLNVDCPNPTRPAPVLGHALLGGLGALLGGLGMWSAARRRRRPGR